MTHKCPKAKGAKCTCPPGKLTKAKKTGTKRPLNEFMKKAQAARKSGASSFQYKDKTYYKKMTKTGMAVYTAKAPAKK